MKECAEFYVKPYQYNAFADFIIRNHPDYIQWVNGNFVQLFGEEKADAIYVDYYCGNVYGKLSLLQVKDYSYLVKENKQDEVKQLIENGLKEKKYYYCFLDHFYLEGMPEYQKEETIHDVLLLSTDENSVKYMENVRGYFSEFIIPDSSFYTNLFGNTAGCLFELQVNHQGTYAFNMHHLILMQEDYLYSKNPMEHDDIYMDKTGFFSEEFYAEKEGYMSCFGLDVYEMVAKLSKAFAKNKEYIDYRMYYILIERNELMMKRFSFLVENGLVFSEEIQELSDGITEICKRLKLCLNHIIKYNIKKQESEVLTVCEELLLIQAMEKENAIKTLNLFYEVEKRGKGTCLN